MPATGWREERADTEAIGIRTVAITRARFGMANGTATARFGITVVDIIEGCG